MNSPSRLLALPAVHRSPPRSPTRCTATGAPKKKKQAKGNRPATGVTPELKAGGDAGGSAGGDAAGFARIEELGRSIREMKAGKAPSAEVLLLVAEMNGLKESLAAVIEQALIPIRAALCCALEAGPAEAAAEAAADCEASRLLNLLPPKRKKKLEKQLREAKRDALAAARARFDTTAGTSSLRVQRKISHLLAHQGHGDDFVYFNKLVSATHHQPLTPGPSRPLTLPASDWQDTAAHGIEEGATILSINTLSPRDLLPAPVFSGKVHK